MRYGVYVGNSKATAQILLTKAVKGDVIWSNETVKGLLQDIITLHDEIEHADEVIAYWRGEAEKLRHKQGGVK